MALKPRSKAAPFDCENVEAIAAGVAADERAPGGEWIVRQGSIWRSTHPVVIAHSAWFAPLGDAQTSAPFWPVRDAE